MGGELAVEAAPDQLHLLGAAAAPGKDLSRVLLRPMAVTAGIEQHQVRQAAGVAQRVLQRHMPAERVAEHRPPLKAQLFPQRLGIGGQVLKGHGRDRGAC